MADAAFYHWDVKRSPASIEVSLEVIDRLSAMIRERAASESIENAGRAPEFGGLLLGTIQDDRTIVIHDFEELPSEHRRGASFDLSVKDRALLSRRLARRGRNEFPVVGYFRSHTRPGMYMDEDDYAVATEFFASPSRVFLLIKPNPDGVPTAGFFFWENGHIDRRETCLPFPFDRNLLLTEGHPVAVEQADVEAEDPDRTIQTAPVTAQPRKKARAVALGASTFMATAAVVPLLALLIAGTWSHFRTKDAASKHKPVPAKEAAVKEAPATAPGGNAAAADAALVANSAPATPPPTIRASPFRSPNTKTTQAVRSPNKTSLPTPAEKEQPSDLEPVVEARATPERAVSTKPRPRPRAESSVALEPVAESRFRRTVGHIPLLGKLARSRKTEDFIPAQPLRQTKPQLSPELIRELTAELPVDVRIRIAKNGMVEQAELLTRDVDAAFADLAVNAAARWDFRPALFKDEPVPSEMVAHFRFRRLE